MKLPRPKGLTKLIHYYNMTNNEEDYYRAIRLIIAHYTSNGFTILGIPLSLSELSGLYQVPEHTFQNQVLEVSNLYSPIFRSTKIEDQIALRATLFAEILGASQLGNSQILRANELISNELTYPNSNKVRLPYAHALFKGIETSTKVQASIIALVNALFPAQNITQILNLQAESGPKKDVLTASEAMEMVGEMAQKALNNPDFMAQLASKHGLEDPEKVPEVRASGAVDTDGTYIKASKNTLIPDTLDTIHYSID